MRVDVFMLLRGLIKSVEAFRCVNLRECCRDIGVP